MAASLGGEPQRLDTVAYTCCDMLVSCLHAGDVERAVAWCRHADAFIDRYGCPFLYAECRLAPLGFIDSVGGKPQPGPPPVTSMPGATVLRAPRPSASTSRLGRSPACGPADDEGARRCVSARPLR